MSPSQCGHPCPPYTLLDKTRSPFRHFVPFTVRTSLSVLYAPRQNPKSVSAFCPLRSTDILVRPIRSSTKPEVRFGILSSLFLYLFIRFYKLFYCFNGYFYRHVHIVGYGIFKSFFCSFLIAHNEKYAPHSYP